MGIAVIIALLIVGIVLFEANRRGILHNDRLQALVGITAIVGVLAGVIQFVVPVATEDEPNATPEPSIEIAIPSSETPVPATMTPAPATEAPISPTNTPVPATQTPAPATEAPIAPTNTPIPATQTPPSDGPIATVTLSPTPTKTPVPTVPIPAGVQVVDTRVAEEDGMIQVYVPEGHFLMGSVEGDAKAHHDEIPQRSVYLDAFWIDQVEVTNGMYALCVKADECNRDPGSLNDSSTRDSYFDNPEYRNYPVIYVSWNDAETYCRWAGRRLPTEAEWEKTARGRYGETYPWGNEFPTAELLNFNGNVGDTTKVGNYPLGASPYGALDMAGNVWEWVADSYVEDYYQQEPPNYNPQGPTISEVKVYRGGSWYKDEFVPVRAPVRVGSHFSDFNDVKGFRCAASP